MNNPSDLVYMPSSTAMADSTSFDVVRRDATGVSRTERQSGQRFGLTRECSKEISALLTRELSFTGGGVRWGKVIFL